MRKLFFIAAFVALLFWSSAPEQTYAITQIKDDPISTGLEAYWAFDEASSGTRVDATSTVDLTDTNTVEATTGKLGNAADIEYSNTEYLSVTDANAPRLDLSTTGNKSFSMWFKPESLSNTVWLIGKDGNNPQRGWLHYYEPGEASGDPHKWRWSYDGNNMYESHNHGVSPCTDFAVDTWIHVAVSYVDSTHTTILYINGSACDTETGNSSGTFNSAAAFWIGNLWAGGGAGLDGAVDETGIWSRALSSSEVSDLYGGGTPPPYEAAAAPATAIPQPVINFF